MINNMLHNIKTGEPGWSDEASIGLEFNQGI